MFEFSASQGKLEVVVLEQIPGTVMHCSTLKNITATGIVGYSSKDAFARSPKSGNCVVERTTAPAKELTRVLQIIVTFTTQHLW